MSSSSVTFPIQSFFPASQYEKKCLGNPELISMYLIALKQPNQKIIEQLKAKNNPNYQEPDYGFTALCVATIMQNHEVMEYLIREKANPTPEDFGRLTPLHYACALKDIKSVTLLQSAMGVEKIAQDIFEIFPGWKKFFKPDFPQETDYVAYWKKEDEISQITAKEFFEKTGAKYYDGILFTQKSFLYLLSERTHQQICHRFPFYSNLNEKMCKQFKEKDPESYKTDFFISSENEEINVCAKKPIARGEICFPYGGMLNFGQKKTHCSLENVDASLIRNYGGMIRDAFPNIGVLHLNMDDGTVIPILIALRDIKEHEPLFLDHGFDHPTKGIKRVELNYKEMEAFFKENSISSLLKKIHQKTDDDLDTVSIIKNEYQIHCLKYLFNTPTALLSLCIKNVDFFKTLKNYFNNSNLTDLGKSNAKLVLVLASCLNALSYFFLFIKDEKNNKNCEEFTEFSLEVLKNYSFQVFVSIMFLMNKLELSVQDWKQNQECYKQSAHTFQMLISAFFPPITETITGDYLTKCKDQLALLPIEFQEFILTTVHNSVKLSFPELLQPCQELFQKLNLIERLTLLNSIKS